MSFAASDHQTASLPPRHFWRRLGACLIDIIIFRIALIIIFLAISAVTSWDVALPYLRNQRCEAITSGPLIPKVETDWPLQPGETRTNKLCQVSWLGSKGYKIFVSSVASQQGTTNWTHSVYLPVDDNGNPLDTDVADRPSSNVALLILPFAFAYLSANGRRTLGKRLLSLRVKTTDNGTLPLGLAIKRELFKFLPVILPAILGLISLVLPPSMPTIEQLIQQVRDPNLFTAGGMLSLIGVLTPLLFVFAAIWWLYPLIVWHGQTFYDRFCDTKVVKD
ncbi:MULTISPECIES: RDD family protein [Rhizobium]|uniref:RDD family protein n=1 Tax=Rhizobium miluonense TaxID=411945 RepID=A0A1C3WZ27_9HYPH|nr:RDD family protein [Rhizobium miluonense]SCB45272.1 RDD family protein [Rhizobium miluonense]